MDVDGQARWVDYYKNISSGYIQPIPDSSTSDEFTHICTYCHQKLHTQRVNFRSHAFQHGAEVGLSTNIMKNISQRY